MEEKEELELCCTQLKGDARVYRQQNKQTLRQLEEVIQERDKVRRTGGNRSSLAVSEDDGTDDVMNTDGWAFQALSSRAEQQEEVRLLLQEKDQYREQVRQLTEQSDRLELLLLRSQGEELQLRTRLRRLTCNTHQVRRRS